MLAGQAGFKAVAKMACAQILPDQCSIRFDPVGVRSTQERWLPPVGHMLGRIDTGTMAAVPPVLILSHTTRFFSLCVTGISQVAAPPLEPRVSTHKQVSLCAGCLRGCLGFQPPSFLPGWTEGLFADLHCEMLWGLFLPA